MATNRKFNARHGLSTGSGTTQKDIVTEAGQVVDVGLLTDLTTAAKTDIVAAINELNFDIANLPTSLTVLSRAGSGVVINAPTATLQVLNRAGTNVPVVF